MNADQNIFMARSKLHKDGIPSDRKMVNASGAKGQTQNHDPTLVSLFAQSVGIILRVQMHSTGSQILTSF